MLAAMIARPAAVKPLIRLVQIQSPMTAPQAAVERLELREVHHRKNKNPPARAPTRRAARAMNQAQLAVVTKVKAMGVVKAVLLVAKSLKVAQLLRAVKWTSRKCLCPMG